MEGNPYYSPEKFGLEIIGEINDPDASYSFDMVVFWRKGRQVYAAADSGCSCPSPFEEVKGIDDLTRIHSVAEARRFIEAQEEEWMRYAVADKQAALRAVGKALRGESIQ